MVQFLEGNVSPCLRLPQSHGDPFFREATLGESIGPPCVPDGTLRQTRSAVKTREAVVQLSGIRAGESQNSSMRQPELSRMRPISQSPILQPHTLIFGALCKYCLTLAVVLPL